jgi:integrase/recombinase XerD
MSNELVKKSNDLVVTQKALIQAGYDSLSPATRSAYESDLKSYYAITGKGIETSTMADIMVYIKVMEKKGYKNATINRKIYSISRIFNLYKSAGIIAKNPIEDLNDVKRISRKTSKQISAQVELKDLEKIYKKGGKIAIIIETLANTGLRISELLNIQYKDMEAYAHKGAKYIRVRIIGKGSKERFIFLSHELKKRIKKQFPFRGGDYLFYTKKDTKFSRHFLKAEIKRMFLDLTGKDIHPHSLRHFYATYKINVEKQDIKAVSKYLGHSGASITLDMYVDTALDAGNSMIQGRKKK